MNDGHSHIPVPQLIQDEWNEYRTARTPWADQVQEDREFRMGRQWTDDQVEQLKARGQAPIVINRIHPAVEFAKAIITAHRPRFTVAPKEDSDNKVAQVIGALLEYIYYISDGNRQLRRAVDDYYTSGMGAMLVYQDPMADQGRGDVKVKAIDPLDLYVDPNSRDEFCDDARSIIYSRLFTKDQAYQLYPKYLDAIQAAEGHYDPDHPTTDKFNSGETFFPSDITMSPDEDYVRGFERYTKVEVERYRVFEPWSGREELLKETEFEAYLEQPALVVGDQVFTNANYFGQILTQAQSAGLPADAITYRELLQDGTLQVVKTTVNRVKMQVVVGDQLLYERILPVEHYPVIFFMNQHTRTPFPTGDVRLVRGNQEFVNKLRSLMIAHATTQTNAKVLIQSGSVDLAKFREEWAQPGIVMELDMEEAQPVVVQPQAFSSELFHLEKEAKNDIDHQLGLYELMMGNSEAAPTTYKATIAVDEYGQRKMRTKLAQIESALTRMGQVVLPLMQQLYTTEKVFRLVQPNNSLNEYVVNKRLVDDKTEELQVVNDITVGMYDVMVIAGSTLPSNRWAELELYMDAYEKGIIDRQEVLKKTEVFDMEGVLRRTDMIAKMEQQIQQMDAYIQDLEGDMQTKDRELVHLKNRVETQKFKSKLDRVANRAEMSGELYQRDLERIARELNSQPNAGSES